MTTKTFRSKSAEFTIERFIPWQDVQCNRRGRRERPIPFPGRIERIPDQQTMGRGPRVRDRHPALGCTADSFRGECIVSSGTHEKLDRRESHATTVIRPPDAE
jgi:hypothetical protein